VIKNFESAPNAEFLSWYPVFGIPSRFESEGIREIGLFGSFDGLSLGNKLIALPGDFF